MSVRKLKLAKISILFLGVMFVIVSPKIFTSFTLIDVVFAQELDQEQIKQQPQDQLTKQQLLFYLANEKVVAPGVGFLNAQIGDPMSSIVNAWGKPVDQRKTGLLGSLEFLYQPDPNTLVVFTGKERLKTISIKGNSASLLRTQRGARFGLSSLNIVRMFSQIENVVKRNRIEYPQLGISFYVSANSKVNKMIVYAPKSN